MVDVSHCRYRQNAAHTKITVAEAREQGVTSSDSRQLVM